jgi:chromosome segregation ATPase
MDERMDDANAQMGSIETELRTLTELVGEVARNQRRTDEQLSRLIEAQERTAQQIAQISGHTNETDARLDRLATMIELHVTNGHGQT